MKIGVRAHDFGKKDEFELSKQIKEAGFDCVQLALTKAIFEINSFDDITEEKVFKVKEAFLKNNVEISVLGCYIEPSIFDKKQRLKNVEIFKKHLHFAKIMDIKIVATETTSFDLEENQREGCYKNLLESVLYMSEIAEKENIFIGIEPVCDHTLNNTSITKRLLSDVKSDKLKIVFDPSNLIFAQKIDFQNLILEEFMSAFSKEIVAIHAKDFLVCDNKKVFKPLGQGLLNYDLIFDFIFEKNIKVPILKEGATLESYNIDFEFLSKHLNKL